jgi:hypothetical protein
VSSSGQWPGKRSLRRREPFTHPDDPVSHSPHDFACTQNKNAGENETFLSLFDCYVASVLNYASAIIGTHGGLNLERVHLDFFVNDY